MRMRALLAKAKKPMAVVGGSCWTVQGRAALQRFLADNDRTRDGGIPPPGALRRHAGEFCR